MSRLSLAALLVVCAGSVTMLAQEAHPPQKAEQERPTHGIIRKPQRKQPAETSKPTAAEPGKSAEPVKAAPSASTEVVAAAIANAVRALEEKEKTEPAAPPPPARRARPLRAVPVRRYSVKWPSQRFEVQWAAPDDRVTLSWAVSKAQPNALKTSDDPSPDAASSSVTR